MIDSIEENYIRFRTSANAKEVEVKTEDILEIGADENKIFDEETVCALYRGKIYVEGKNSMESPEYAWRRIKDERNLLQQRVYRP